MQNQQRPNSVSGLNMSATERQIALLGGGALVAVGIEELVRGKFPGALMAGLGSILISSGVTGYSFMFEALNVNHAELGLSDQVSVPHEQGIRAQRIVFVERSADELYRFWHNFENLPRFMKHVESVRVLDDLHSHWAIRGPAGVPVEWDAVIVNEVIDELIAWRSLPGAAIPNAGSVAFIPVGFGTEVRVILEYAPPAGQLGLTIAKLFGTEPEKLLEDDIYRFKTLLETGEVSSV